MSTLEEIFDNGGPRVLVFNVKPLDSNGDIVDIWVSSRNRMVTKSSDTPSLIPFIFRKELRGWEATFKFSGDKSLLDEGLNKFGKLDFDNFDKLLDDWLTYNFDDAPFVMYLGLEKGIDQLEFSWSEFAIYAKGQCKEILRDKTGKRRVIIPLLGQLNALKTRAVIDNIQLPFTVEFPNDGSVATIPYDASFDFSSSLSVELAIVIDGSAHNGVNARTEIGGSPGSIPLFIGVTVEGISTFGLIAAGGSYVCESDRPLDYGLHMISGVWDGNDMFLSVDGEIVSTVPLSISPELSTDGFIIGGLVVFGDAPDNATHISEFRYGPNIVRTQQEIRDNFRAPLNDFSWCTIYLKFDEGSGTIAADSSGGGHDASPVPDSWIPLSDLNLDSQDLGSNWPYVYGTIFNGPARQHQELVVTGEVEIPLASFSPGDRLFMFSKFGLNSIERIRINGVESIEDHNFISNNIEFKATDNLIIGDPGNFSPFIEGQADPVRAGQLVTISGSASNSGDFTIADASESPDVVPGINTDGSEMSVVEAIVNEASGPSIDIGSTNSQWRKRLDLGSVVFFTSIPNDPDGGVHGDVTGFVNLEFLRDADLKFILDSDGNKIIMPSTGSDIITGPEIIEKMSGLSFDVSELVDNPAVGLFIEEGEDRTIMQYTTDVKKSLFAYLSEDPGGDLRFAPLIPPAGAPIASFEALSASLLGYFPVYWSTRVGHTRNWGPLSPGVIRGQAEKFKDILGRKYTWETDQRISIKNANRTSSRLDLETLLINSVDAANTLSRAIDLVIVKRPRWKLVLPESAQKLKPGDEINVFHKDYKELEIPVDCIVYKLKTKPIHHEVTVEIYL